MELLLNTIIICEKMYYFLSFLQKHLIKCGANLFIFLDAKNVMRRNISVYPMFYLVIGVI